MKNLIEYGLACIILMISFGIIFLIAPWVLFVLGFIFSKRLNPLRYWDWCIEKQSEIKARREKP